MPVPTIPPRLTMLRGLAVLGLLTLMGACGPRPTEPAPIQRGTALPPPGLDQPPSR